MSDKEIKDNWLLITILICILLFACLAGCTTSQPSGERLRSHQVKYKAALTGGSIVYYRAVDGGAFKVVGSQPSGLNTKDTVWTEIKTTSEKY